MSSGYAAALADTAKAAGQLDNVHADTETLAAYMKANAGIATFLRNPVIGESKKKEVIAKIAKEARARRQLASEPLPAECLRAEAAAQGGWSLLRCELCTQGSFTPTFANFLNLLVDKRRIALSSDICEEFEEIYCNLTDTQARPPPSPLGLPTLGTPTTIPAWQQRLSGLRLTRAVFLPHNSIHARPAGRHRHLRKQDGERAAVPDSQEAAGAHRCVCDTRPITSRCRLPAWFCA